MASFSSRLSSISGLHEPKKCDQRFADRPKRRQGYPLAILATAFGSQRYTDHTQYSASGVFVNDDKTAGIYKSPINADNNCGKNYIILIGNNLPNSDNNNKFLLDNLQYPVVRNDLCLPGSSAQSDVLG